MMKATFPSWGAAKTAKVPDHAKPFGRVMPLTVAAAVPQAVADADANHDGKISLQARALPLRGSFADCDVIVAPPQSGADDCLRTYRAP